MNISILCTDRLHPVIERLNEWVKSMAFKQHKISLVFDKTELLGGDILFLVSCGQMIGDHERAKYKSTLVLHASDLPKRRGWSPHIWSILDGENEITVSLLEATKPIDTGLIWLKTSFVLEGHELIDEINNKLFDAEIFLMTCAIDGIEKINPSAQVGDPGSYMKKRSPADSEIDPEKSILEQFNLLRIVDSDRYPAFFYHHGYKYQIKIKKVKSE
jgi:methionyl-tRNA formyltransferase